MGFVDTIFLSTNLILIDFALCRSSDDSRYSSQCRHDILPGISSVASRSRSVSLYRISICIAHKLIEWPHYSGDEALQVLADLHGGGDLKNELVVLEFEEIKEQVRFENQEGAKSYLDLLKPGMPRRVGLGMALQMWSQLTGMNVMMYVSLHIFSSEIKLTYKQVLYHLCIPWCWSRWWINELDCFDKSGRLFLPNSYR